MRAAILILAVLGSVFTITIGAFSGSLLSLVGCAASHLGAPQAGADASAAASSILIVSVLQCVLGLVGGIHAHKSLGRGNSGQLGGVLLLCCTLLSLGAGILTLFTGGLLHLAAGALALAAEPRTSAG